MRVAEETKRIRAEVQGRGAGEGRQVSADMEDGVAAPEDKNDHHDGGDLHDLQSLVAGLFEAFDVLPPVIDGDDDRADGRGVVHGQLRHVMVGAEQEAGQPAVRCADFE